MDILYLIHYAGRAGTEKYVRELMGLYTRQGHRCHLCYCVPAGLEEDAQADEVEQLAAKLKKPYVIYRFAKGQFQLRDCLQMLQRLLTRL